MAGIVARFKALDNVGKQIAAGVGSYAVVSFVYSLTRPKAPAAAEEVKKTEAPVVLKKETPAETPVAAAIAETASTPSPSTGGVPSVVYFPVPMPQAEQAPAAASKDELLTALRDVQYRLGALERDIRSR